MEASTAATPYTPKSTNRNPQTPTQSPITAPSSRLWRPTAQRNLRNQWSKLASLRQEWDSASSNGRANATSLVNAYLSIKYMGSRELGVLSEMPDIVNKASQKLLKQQELHRSKLLSSYKDMVSVVAKMVKTSRSMRCFVKGSSNSPLLQFSGYSECNNDPGDGGGIPVFTFWSISCFEKVAEELVHMLVLELNLKRLLVVDLLSVSGRLPMANSLHWSEELYPGEFGDLSMCNLISEETCKPIYPRLHGQKSDRPAIQHNQQPDHDVLQVYLTTWLVEVNIDTQRVDEIFAEVGEELHCKLS
ncbi:uncharacterized protein LOC126794965 [Argentina anserina]|uniref:uncharacterized protein LOC126794965 n=1 Tax=Argentina anserina TaxID=57926 RepID=UPI0021768B1F|nr:uncharacterized protein LOC126794965 [Potentilla anserina]